MELYDYILSADAYKVRLFCALLKIPYTPVKVDLHPGRETLTPAFRAHVNPRGRIPVLKDGTLTLHDAQSILTYLALRHDPARLWLPEAPEAAARIVDHLLFAAVEFAALETLRLAKFTDETVGTDDPAVRAAAMQAMACLEDMLAAREIDGGKWLVGDHPTIADIALFPSASLAPDAGLALEHYPAIWRWVERIRHLPGFIVMPGIFPTPPDVREQGTPAQ